ncbi:hypothetical protein DSM3645_21694 [Blastopirellula marina DSM 3645]|uniref:Uncharacterized protein n=1 Tax=Blastopirellula marina DSM 3645 TaxID=314230 RepID=A3ZU66_9BACT|nr:hypothetical protein DSM3645_21694 [Blastopirellula marina DSM 3645]
MTATCYKKNDPVRSTRPLRKKTRGGPVHIVKLVTKYRRRQVVGKTSPRREPMEEGRRSQRGSKWPAAIHRLALLAGVCAV